MLPILTLDEDSSEEDEDLDFQKALQDAIKNQQKQILTENIIQFTTYESSDFIDAQKAINENRWDSTAWELFIEEVENGRGGKFSKVDAYIQATNQFPRAWKFWKRLVDHYMEVGDVQPCEDAFKKCLQKCRNTDLWLSYLTLTRQKTIDKNPPNSEQYANSKRIYESAFEKALENIGMSFDSHIIWRKYLDFVKDWPESGALDAGRKLTALREIYQKAICNPMDDLDRYWKEYEELEMKAGEHLANQLIPEFKPKYLNAKNVYKERKRMSQSILLDRISIPPTVEGTVSEVQQLELWNKWIRYEMDNPDKLPEEQQRQYMRLLYDKCLCCFRLHPEVWLSLARYELTAPSTGVVQARAVLKEALTTLPQSTILWLELSELEERYNGVDAAAEILRNAFEQIPSAFTFALLQRIIRRRDGKNAARKVFTETIGMRHEGILGFETYLAHASMELDVNNEPEVALKVLELAKALHPTSTNTIDFLKLMTRILIRLGDVRQLRWVFQTALGGLNTQSSYSLSSPDVSLSTLISKPVVKQINGFTLDEQYTLWKEYLNAELTFGMSDVQRLSQLRERIRAIRSVFDENKLKSASYDQLVFSPSDVFNLYEPVLDIYSRCERILFCLPVPEMALRNRSRGVNFLNELIQRADDRLVSLMESGYGKKRMLRRDGESTIDSNLLNNVPIFLRDLLARLPPHTGPPPDIDTFLEHLRKTVLPPRPVTDERDDNVTQTSTSASSSSSSSLLSSTIQGGTNTTSTISTLGVGTIANSSTTIAGNGQDDDIILLSGTKRAHNYDEDDEDDDIGGDRNDDGSRDDIFQQRCRRRMAQE